MPAQKASADPQYPALQAALDWKTLYDAFKHTRGGIFFPAARYHRYLSHLSVHVEVMITRFNTMGTNSPMPTFIVADPENGAEGSDMEQMHTTVEYMLVRL